ncbi:hypothetical protein CWS43_06145 [Rahnella sp. AA]|nr:hypothetical protein CWS43_06145 [Rahnella sp. AA]
MSRAFFLQMAAASDGMDNAIEKVSVFHVRCSLRSKPWVATQTGKTLGSPPKLAQRVLNETLWNPAFF